MVDFKKKLGKKMEKKSIDPVEIYDSLDRASDKEPALASSTDRSPERGKRIVVVKNVILKLHTAKGRH
jgi:hypothetical protein